MILGPRPGRPTEVPTGVALWQACTVHLCPDAPSVRDHPPTGGGCTSRGRPFDPRHHHPGTHGLAVDVLLAVTRVSLGWIFLWAFLDKLFGLGHETPPPSPGSTVAGPVGGGPHDG
ncbi:hypothetical protein FRAHR75_40167 [Frankia sp. Hr75.2]|nr:hypothetical protein FRAHR75_40167 [Frankia sp. Hr75.2]